MTDGERAILKNQRLIMLALANLVREQSMGGEYMANLLRERVKDMERYWEWIAPPSQRL